MSQPDLFDVGKTVRRRARQLAESPLLVNATEHNIWSVRKQQQTKCEIGTGPVGERCGTCHFLVLREHMAGCVKAPLSQKTMFVYGDVRELASNEACQKWQPAPGYEPLDLCPPGFPLDAVRESPGIAADWWEDFGDIRKAEMLRGMVK